MRLNSDALWKLVNTMSSREKLFFRRNFTDNRSASKSIYLKLFDALASQKSYDEEALIRKFSPAINKKNIAAQKHYLYRQLCDALLVCDTKEDDTHEIYRSIQLIRLLRKKGMLDEAHGIWKQTVSRARKSEAFAFLNLLKAEFGKMILFSGNQAREEELLSIFKGNIISYDEFTELMNLRDIYTEVLLLKQKAHFDIDEPLREELRQLLKRVEKHEEHQPARSFWFRHYLRMNKATLLYLLNENSKALVLLDETWNDWKQHQHYLRSESEFFTEVLYMINYVGVLEGKYNYVEKVFDDPLNAHIGHAQRANFEAVRYLALNKIYNKTARYKEVEALVKEVKKKYKAWEPVLSPDMNRTLTLSVGIASLALEKYDDAIYFIRRALSSYRKGTRQEHESVGHLLLLLGAWSWNNSKFFDAQYRHTYNYFYKSQKKRPYETLLVQCFQKTFYMKDNREKTEVFRKTLEQLEQSNDDKIQQMAFSIFNFPGWLNARIQKIPYRKFVERSVQVSAEK